MSPSVVRAGLDCHRKALEGREVQSGSWGRKHARFPKLPPEAWSVLRVGERAAVTGESRRLK